MSDAAARKEQARREALYCERILAKSGLSLATAAIGDAHPIVMQHYPARDLFDPDSGAQFYYHCHAPDSALDEHGHFHCFLRPNGAEGPIHHLVGIGISRAGRLNRLFTVNRWVTGEQWLGAEHLIPLIERFDLQMAVPNYLVNRWLTAVVSLYREEIAHLLIRRDAALGGRDETAREDRALEVLSAMAAELKASPEN